MHLSEARKENEEKNKHKKLFKSMSMSFGVEDVSWTLRRDGADFMQAQLKGVTYSRQASTLGGLHMQRPKKVYLQHLLIALTFALLFYSFQNKDLSGESKVSVQGMCLVDTEGALSATPGLNQGIVLSALNAQGPGEEILRGLAVRGGQTSSHVYYEHIEVSFHVHTCFFPFANRSVPVLLICGWSIQVWVHPLGLHFTERLAREVAAYFFGADEADLHKEQEEFVRGVEHSSRTLQRVSSLGSNSGSEGEGFPGNFLSGTDHRISPIYPGDSSRCLFALSLSCQLHATAETGLCNQQSQAFLRITHNLLDQNCPHCKEAARLQQGIAAKGIPWSLSWKSRVQL